MSYTDGGGSADVYIRQGRLESLSLVETGQALNIGDCEEIASNGGCKQVELLPQCPMALE